MLTCKSLFGLGYRGERLIEPSGRALALLASANMSESTEDPVTEGTRAVTWLNSLSQGSASKLLNWIESIKGPVEKRASVDVSDMVKLNASVPGPEGEGWMQWITCRILPKREGDLQRHRRVQINFPSKPDAAGTNQISSPTRVNSQAAQLKRLLEPAEWDGLKEAAVATPTGRGTIKLWTHHVACVAGGHVSLIAAC